MSLGDQKSVFVDSGFIFGIFLMLGMTMVTVAAIFAVPALIKGKGRSKAAKRAVQGMVAGVFLFLFVIFPDMGLSILRPFLAPGFKVTLPQDYSGYVQIYYRDEKPRTKLGSDFRYQVEVSKTGEATIKLAKNAFVDGLDFEFCYPDQTEVDWIYVGGSLSQVHETYLVGDTDNPPDAQPAPVPTQVAPMPEAK